ncbi:MAG: hypothetical protein ACRDNW_10400 [Trebonia sp.]
MRDAEAKARSDAGRQLTAASGMAETNSLGSQLRTALVAIGPAVIERSTPRPVSTLAAAISEWQRLAPRREGCR